MHMQLSGIQQDSLAILSSNEQPYAVSYPVIPSQALKIALSNSFMRLFTEITQSPLYPQLALTPVSYEDAISALPDTRYGLIQPIPIRLNREESGDWTAHFKEANISMSGTSPEDATQALADDIGYALDFLLAERNTLSPVLQDQLAVLERYVRRDSQ